MSGDVFRRSRLVYNRVAVTDDLLGEARWRQFVIKVDAIEPRLPRISSACFRDITRRGDEATGRVVGLGIRAGGNRDDKMLTVIGVGAAEMACASRAKIRRQFGD